MDFEAQLAKFNYISGLGLMDFEAQLAKFNYISGFGLMDFEAQLAVFTTVFTTACTIGPNPGRPPFQGF